MTRSTTPSFKAELAEAAALMELRLERTRALRQMFQGRQLIRKSKLADAMKIAKEARDAASKLKKALPQVHVPDLVAPKPNFDLLRGINLREIPNFRLPSIPDYDLNLIPDIQLKNIPNFNLQKLRVDLGFLTNLELLPDLKLRLLLGYLAVKLVAFDLPSIIQQLNFIFDVDMLKLPGFPTAWFDFEPPTIELPDVNLPDVNLPRVPALDLPTINLPSVDIPGLDVPDLLKKLPGFDRVLRLLFELFDLCDIGIIIEELGLEAVKEFISAALPIVGQIKNGAQAAKKWYDTARGLHRARKVTKQKQFLLPGNARDAAEAVRKLLKEKAKDDAVAATVKTSQFAVGTAGLFADLGAATGPAVSAAGTIATICWKITRLAGEYKQRTAINRYLKQTDGDMLTSEIFTLCPLLGAMFLANSTRSTIANFLVEDITSDDFMENFEENNRKYIEPLIKEATKFIVASGWTLYPPLPQNIGSFEEPGRIQRWKQKFLAKVRRR
jgi:hypothetical protein